MSTQVDRETVWPALRLADWQDTYATLQRWAQIVGKTRLAHAPMLNHWWQVALYISARGLTTSPIPYHDRDFEIEFDFLEHRLITRTSDGDVRTMDLVPCSVAEFYHDYTRMLRSLDIEPQIWPVPNELADALPFPEDHIHAAYDADAAQRCWRILMQSDRVLKEFRSNFLGKCSPSHFFWGAFDLACTRFSGREAPLHPGGVPNLPDRVVREAYSHECISAGWWPGTIGGALDEPAYYAYAYAEPPGCPEATIRPEGAYYHDELHEWILPYEIVRTSADPDATLLTFFESTYETAARLGDWPQLLRSR